MFNPGIISRIHHWVDEKTTGLFSSRMRKKLNNTDFTIISNNCWGGVTYEHFGLPKQSPTIGGYFFAKDYLSFISNLKQYMNVELEIISLDDAIHKKEIIDNGNTNAIVGRLNGSPSLPIIEIVFLHYKDPKIVVEKWNRRKKRINYNNLIFKFSKQNCCTEQELFEFDKMNLPGKKIMFVNTLEAEKCYDSAVYYPGFENSDQVENDTFYWNKYFDVIKFINDGKIYRKR